jgi:hypothetical protein
MVVEFYCPKAIVTPRPQKRRHVVAIALLFFTSVFVFIALKRPIDQLILHQLLTVLY